MTSGLPPMMIFQPLRQNSTTGRLETLPLAKLYSYAAGSLVPQALYAEDGITPLSNPVELNAEGYAQIRFGALAYKLLLNDANGATVAPYPIDNIWPTAGLQSLADLTTTVTNFIADVGSSAAGKGDALLAVGTRTQHDKNSDTVSLFDYLTGANYAAWLINQTGFDVAAIFQSAIDDCITKQKRLFIPIGWYSISAPLHIWQWSGTAFSFCTLHLEGEFFPYNANLAGLKGVTIAPTFNDTAAIFVQAGRTITLKNLFIKGKNVPNLAYPWDGLFVNANYVQGGARDQRYSPYAGICVDPFGTSVPVDGGYPGFTSYYVASNTGGTGTMLLENVRVENFVTAMVISPNGTTQNAENIVLHNCHLSLCKVGLAICQSQSRNVIWEGGSAGFNLFFADGKSYGLQQGSAPAIFGLNASGKYLFNFSAGQGGARPFHGIYTENLGGIGFFGPSSSTNDAVVFSGCIFKFFENGGVGVDFHLVTHCPTTFVGCTLNNYTFNMPIRLYHNVPTAPINFAGCNFMLSGTELLLAPTTGTANQDWDGITFDGCTAALNGGVSGGFSHNTQRYQDSNLNRAFVPLGATIKLASGGNGILRYVHPTPLINSLGSIAITVVPGTPATATFNPADSTVVRVGDMIALNTATNFEGPGLANMSSTWTPVGVVSANNGTTVVITGLPQSLVSGTYALYTSRIPRFHQATTLTTNSTTAISAMTNPTAWAAGDPIFGAGIPVGAYLVSTDGAGNAVLSKAATASASGVRAYDANVYSFTGVAV